MFRRNTSSPRRSTLSSTSSLGSSRVTTAAAPQSRTLSRSRERSRTHSPVIACLSYFPGQNVMPIRPKLGPALTIAICRGCVNEVRFIHYLHYFCADMYERQENYIGTELNCAV